VVKGPNGAGLTPVALPRRRPRRTWPNGHGERLGWYWEGAGARARLAAPSGFHGEASEHGVDEARGGELPAEEGIDDGMHGKGRGGWSSNRRLTLSAVEESGWPETKR
jgi:hypothetical protein